MLKITVGKANSLKTLGRTGCYISEFTHIWKIKNMGAVTFISYIHIPGFP